MSKSDHFTWFYDLSTTLLAAPNQISRCQDIVSPSLPAGFSITAQAVSRQKRHLEADTICSQHIHIWRQKLTQIIVATWPQSGITFTTKNVGTLCVAVPFFGRAFCPISLGLWTLGKNELHKLLSDSGPYPYANPWCFWPIFLGVDMEQT